MAGKKVIKRCVAYLILGSLILGSCIHVGFDREKVLAGSVQNYVVVLDPGHDGIHGGNNKNGLREEVLNLTIALACKKELETYSGVTVYMTRSDSSCPNGGGDNKEELKSRSKYAVSVNADLFVSLHCNAFDNTSLRGVEIYYPNTNYRKDLSDKGKCASERILSELTNLGLQDRGIRIRYSEDYKYPDGSVADYYSVIRESKKLGVAGIIIEHAYQSNELDVNTYLNSDAKLEKLGMADAIGIARYFGLSKVSTTYEGVDYSAVYDPDYYSSQKDVAAAYGNNKAKLLQHFIQYGMNEGRQANKTFNVYSYRGRYKDLQQAFGLDLKRYYLHYMKYGQKEGRNAAYTAKICVVDYVIDGESVFKEEVRYGHPAKNTVYKENGKTALWDMKLDCITEDVTVNGRMAYLFDNVDYSLVFDAEYYLNKYPDLKRAFGNDGQRALVHFINYGMKEGRQASPNFNVISYKNCYADLRRAYGTDLRRYYLHFIKCGSNEKRVATGYETVVVGAVTTYEGIDYSLVYDYNYYVGKYADIKKAFGTDDMAVLRHFVNYGMKEGRQAKATFHVQTYKNKYADLQKAYGSNLKSYYIHYINYGMKEGRVAA